MCKFQVFIKLFFVLFLSLFVACQSSRIEKIEENLFRVQTRVLHMDTDLSQSKAIIQNSDQNFRQQQAHSDVNHEKYKVALQKISGDIDLLKQGVIHGRLPDQDPQAPSIASKILNLEEKIKSLENTQMEIIELIKKISTEKEKKAAIKTNERARLSSFKSFEKAFKAKRYLHVVEDYKRTKQKIEKKNQVEMKYLYSESLFKLGRIDEAAIAYSDLLEDKNLTSRNSKVYLRLGDCFRFLGEKKTALLYYQDLLNKYPQTKEATFAKKYIETLKKQI